MYYYWLCVQVLIHNKHETDKEPHNPIDLLKIERMKPGCIMHTNDLYMIRSIDHFNLRGMHDASKVRTFVLISISFIDYIGHYITLENNEIAFWYQNKSHESWLKVKRQVGLRGLQINTPRLKMMLCNVL